MEIVCTYGSLSFAIVSLWLGNRYNKNKLITWFLFIASVISGLLFRQLEIHAIIIVAAMLVTAKGYAKRDTYRLVYGITYLLLSMLLMLHVIPGFHNLNVVNNLRLTLNAIPYSLYLNFDKALVGFALLFFSSELIKTKTELHAIIKPTLTIGTVTILGMLVVSYGLGYIQLAPKLPAFTGLFLMSNLFFTCMTEEIFFRKLLQQNLKAGLKNFWWGNYAALVTVAVIFGLFHYKGGVSYILLATFAGLGYGWAFEKTNKVESAILIHFTLNAIHFLLFTYPALTSAF